MTSPLPALPAQGSTGWYSWAQGIHARAVDQAPQFMSGRYSSISGVTAGAATPTQSRLRIYPMMINASVTVDRLSTPVSTAVAATTLQWVIYNNSGAYPGTLLLDTGAVGDASTTGLKEATVNITLPRGLVWLGCIAQGGNPGLTHVNGGFSAVGMTYSTADITSGGTQVGYFIDNVTGAAPTTFPAGATASANCPQVWLRAV